MHDYTTRGDSNMPTKQITGLVAIAVLAGTVLLSGCASDKMDSSMDKSMDKPMMKDSMDKSMKKDDSMMKDTM